MMGTERIETVHNRHFEVGNIVPLTFKHNGIRNDVWAMAVKQDGENMIFCAVSCLYFAAPMNKENTNAGGYEASDLRKILRHKFLPMLSEQPMKDAVPFPNGDILRVPTEKEIFGNNIYGEEEPDDITQWEPMKELQNRIAFCGESLMRHACTYWLQNPWVPRDPASKNLFLTVDGFGNRVGCDWPTVRGIRVVFQVKNNP